MLLDSNILIYGADPSDQVCLPFLESDDASISVVSRIEVIGFHGWNNLAEVQRTRLSQIVASLIEWDLSGDVAQQAVALRQQKKMSLADALIAATAIVKNLPLVTRNTGDFKHVGGLTLINPFSPP